MTSSDIERALRTASFKHPLDPDPEHVIDPLNKGAFGPSSRDYPDMHFYNVFIDGAEADVLMVNSITGMIEECEIKVSRADLLRECLISKKTISDTKILRDEEQAKYNKHYKFINRECRYPNYYSFAVPEELVDVALTEAPDYAGILAVREAAVEGHYFVKRVREPHLLTKQKADLTFFASVAKKTSQDYRVVAHLGSKVRDTAAKARVTFLKNIAAALIEVEASLREKDVWSEEAVEFLIHRAVTGMAHREKDSVRRFFTTTQWRTLDLFGDGE